MTIEQMKMILYVAEMSSINQAARRLFISQPALSKSIQAAERELGQPLFERSKTGMQPTDYGRIFCGAARNIVENYERIKHLSVERIQWDYPVLRVNTCPIRFAGLAFAQISRKYAMSASELRFVSSSSSVCVDDVAKGIGDVGLISVTVPMREEIIAELEKVGVCYTPLKQFDPAITVSYDSPLASHSGNTIQREDLAELTLFSIHEDLPVFERMNQEILQMLGMDTAQYTIYYDPRAGLSDLIRPNEFRCNLDSERVYRTMGERNRLLDGARVFHLSPTPFRFEVGIIQRVDSTYNMLVNEYIDMLWEITGVE